MERRFSLGNKVKLTPEVISEIENLLNEGHPKTYAAEVVLGSKTKESTIRSAIARGDINTDASVSSLRNIPKPKVLIFDLETSPLRSYTWGLWNQNVGLNQIHGEWFLLSYAAKWLGEDEIFYDDMRGKVDTEDDTHLLDVMWNLLDQADIVITQNGIKFDSKKINARFILNGYKPPSSYKHIDTLQIAKKTFGFTSNKLQWMTDKLNVDFKKLDHGKFFGFNLWKEMLNDNIEAWEECEEYNKYDVWSLEELYLKMAAWDKSHPNFNLYHHESEHICRCGSKDVVRYGYAYTGKSKFQRWRCNDCGAETRDSINLFDKEKRKSLHLNVRG